MQVGRLRRGIGSPVGVFLQLLEGRPGPVGGKNAVRVEKRADRVLTEILGGAYPFSGRVPVTEIVDLQLNQVLVGIRIVQRGRHPVTEAYLGFDSELLQTRERGHQVIEGVVFEGGMVKTRMDELLRVIPQPEDRQKGDAVIGAVIRHERDAGRLKVDLGANDDGVPIDHFLQSRRWMMSGTRLRWAISLSNRGQVSRVETRLEELGRLCQITRKRLCQIIRKVTDLEAAQQVGPTGKVFGIESELAFGIQLPGCRLRRTQPSLAI
jgi:hypothetical protein